MECVSNDENHSENRAMMETEAEAIIDLRGSASKSGSKQLVNKGSHMVSGT